MKQQWVYLEENQLNLTDLRVFSTSNRPRRSDFDAMFDDVTANHEPILIMQNGEPAIVAMPYAQYLQMVERMADNRTTRQPE